MFSQRNSWQVLVPPAGSSFYPSRVSGCCSQSLKKLWHGFFLRKKHNNLLHCCHFFLLYVLTYDFNILRVFQRLESSLRTDDTFETPICFKWKIPQEYTVLIRLVHLCSHKKQEKRLNFIHPIYFLLELSWIVRSIVYTLQFFPFVYTNTTSYYKLSSVNIRFAATLANFLLSIFFSSSLSTHSHESFRRIRQCAPLSMLFVY